MSVSVQFAADIETGTGCNEEEGLTLLHLVSECQLVAQYKKSSLFYIIKEATFISVKIWKRKRLCRNSKMGWLIISLFKVEKQHKSQESTDAGTKDDNQKGANRVILDEGYIKYLLLGIISWWFEGSEFSFYSQSTHGIKRLKTDSSHQQLPSHPSQLTHYLYMSEKFYTYHQEKFNFAQF